MVTYIMCSIDMQDGLPIKSTATTFRLIEKLVELDGAGITEFYEELDIPKSTIHDHLNSLEKIGYVIKSGTNYRVSTRFLDIGVKLRDNMEIVHVSKPELEKLTKETGEHASLMIEENDWGVIMYTAVGTEASHLIVPAGRRIHLHSNAGGKAILANLPKDRISSIIDEQGLVALTENTITDRNELFDELETIRERGFSINRSERRRGMEAIATPILDNDGTSLGAISVYGPSHQRDDWYEDRVKRLILRSSDVIEVTLNYGVERNHVAEGTR